MLCANSQITKSCCLQSPRHVFAISLRPLLVPYFCSVGVCLLGLLIVSCSVHIMYICIQLSVLKCNSVQMLDRGCVLSDVARHACPKKKQGRLTRRVGRQRIGWVRENAKLYFEKERVFSIGGSVLPRFHKICAFSNMLCHKPAVLCAALRSGVGSCVVSSC